MIGSTERASMLFAIPMIWRVPRDLYEDCYFSTVIIGFSAKIKHKIVYLNLVSECRPVKHDNTLSISLANMLELVKDDNKSNEGAVAEDDHLHIQITHLRSKPIHSMTNE